MTEQETYTVQLTAFELGVLAGTLHHLRVPLSERVKNAIEKLYEGVSERDG